MTAYDRSKAFSDVRLAQLRTALAPITPAGEVVLTCGSFARREASASSDIDFFIITDRQQPAPDHGAEQPPGWMENVKATINQLVPIEPSAEGAFAKAEDREAMLRNIGGENDSNQKITRRMLFLLEGEWLFNQEGLRRVQREILQRYIGKGISNRQLALFLLNDVIRYYRTIAVDYEYKTSEGDVPKLWGIRNIKLIFSRKLLYASGLFSVGKTANMPRDGKVELLEELFEMPVIDRMVHICGASGMENVLSCYNRFLDRLEDEAVRRTLKDLQRDERDNPLFRELKDEGHRLTHELLTLFNSTFDCSHPIHRAVMF